MMNAAYIANENTGNGYFSKYGKDFQERVFQSLLTDHVWAAQMMEVMTSEYFEIKYLQNDRLSSSVYPKRLKALYLLE